MSREEGGSAVLAALAAGTAIVGGALAIGWASWPRPSATAALPSEDWQTAPTWTEADVEAGARMLASENPRGSRSLHIEQIFTQLRSAKPGQSLFDRITAGSGWGPQGEKKEGGKVRPVSTALPATPALRQLVRRVLDGQYRSQLPGARRYFEPAQQDRAFAIAERAREKQKTGQALTAQEQRLLKYHRSAQDIRRKWLAEGARFIESLGGVEFYT